MTAGLAGADPGDLEPFGEHLAGSAPGPSGSWPAGCARPGSSGCAGTGGARWPRPRPPPGASPRPRGWPPASSPRAPAGAGRRRRHHRGLAGRRACTSCASAARNCATCWRSSRPCRPGRRSRRAVKELKGLQDCLGEFQDTEVQRHELRAFAATMMAERQVPAADAAGHGRARGRAGADRQRRARAEFAGLFARVRGARRAGQVRPLTGQARPDEDLRDVQHQGRRGQDGDRGQPGLPGRPRRATGCCCGTWTPRARPASCSGSGRGSRAAARR